MGKIRKGKLFFAVILSCFCMLGFFACGTPEATPIEKVTPKFVVYDEKGTALQVSGIQYAYSGVPKLPAAKLFYDGVDLNLELEIYYSIARNIPGATEHLTEIPVTPGEYEIRFKFRGNDYYNKCERQIMMKILTREIYYFTPTCVVWGKEDFYDQDTVVPYYLNDTYLIGFYFKFMNKRLYNLEPTVVCERDDGKIFDIMPPRHDFDMADIKLPAEKGHYTLTITLPKTDMPLITEAFGDENWDMFNYCANPVTCTVYFEIPEIPPPPDAV